MKLAEALILRADAQKRIAQLRERLNRSAKIQEGEAPPENPQELLAEMERVLAEYTDIIKRINRTNAATPFGEGQTLTDALADRDTLAMERNMLTQLIAATAQPDFRYGRSEIKYVVTVSIADLQKRIDRLAQRHRELDTVIQQMNWQVDLL
ncbi:MAG: DIP1984 family protein [Anaerolineae bacterium]|nr:DIP1984 family protein [Anaerolineae bacterium]